MDSNAYLVIGDGACVVDPGINPAKVLNHSRDYNIRMKVLINTHCHFDHIGANPDILKSGEIAAYCHGSEASVYEKGDDSMQLAGHFGMPAVKHPIDRALSDGDVVDLGGTVLEVIHTPGHTPGCICLFEPDSGTLITGDTVFADGVGRTDFKGGSSEDLEKSLRRLTAFVRERDVKRILPGHGPEAGPEAVEDNLAAYF